MKKLILMAIVSLFSLSAYAIPSIDVYGLTLFKLNSVSSNILEIKAASSGAFSSGVCRLIIRANANSGAFFKATERFRFIHKDLTGIEEEVTPIVTGSALMFKLMKSDFAFESITMETKDGRSIGENITTLFGETVAVMADPCYAPVANVAG